MVIHNGIQVVTFHQMAAYVMFVTRTRHRSHSSHRAKGIRVEHLPWISQHFFTTASLLYSSPGCFLVGLDPIEVQACILSTPDQRIPGHSGRVKVIYEQSNEDGE